MDRTGSRLCLIIGSGVGGVECSSSTGSLILILFQLHIPWGNFGVHPYSLSNVTFLFSPKLAYYDFLLVSTSGFLILPVSV